MSSFDYCEVSASSRKALLEGVQERAVIPLSLVLVVVPLLSLHPHHLLFRPPLYFPNCGCCLIAHRYDASSWSLTCITARGPSLNSSPPAGSSHLLFHLCPYHSCSYLFFLLYSLPTNALSLFTYHSCGLPPSVIVSCNRGGQTTYRMTWYKRASVD